MYIYGIYKIFMNEKKRRLFADMDKEAINDLQVLLWKLMYDVTLNKLFLYIWGGENRIEIGKNLVRFNFFGFSSIFFRTKNLNL